MTEQTTPTAPGSPSITPRRRRRWLFVTMVALLAAFSGAMATRAIGQYGPPGWHHMHGGSWFMRGPLSATDIEDRLDRVVRHAAIELDASAEQQEKVRSIAKAAVKDLLPMREKAQAARERVKGLLTQPKIDRAAIEAFRAEQMALAEAASKRFAQAVGDVAEVLTPEQRQKVQEHLEWRRSHWRPWHRG
jgi:protein CpxP